MIWKAHFCNLSFAGQDYDTPRHPLFRRISRKSKLAICITPPTGCLRATLPWATKICCPSVRIIIDFCEEDLGVRVQLSTGSLNFWFWRIQKWTPLKKVKSWYRPVQGPLFGPSFWNFLATCLKNRSLESRLVSGRQEHYSAWFFDVAFSDVRDTFLRVVLELGTGSTRTKSVASRPCRARCI